MKKARTSDSSGMRRRLREAYDELGKLLPAFLSDDAVFSGYIQDRKVRCGNAGCHCATGEGHPTCAVTYKEEDGSKRQRVLPVADRPRVKQMAEAYRRARRAHKAWKGLTREIKGLIGDLLAARSVAYVPGKENS